MARELAGEDRGVRNTPPRGRRMRPYNMRTRNPLLAHPPQAAAAAAQFGNVTRLLGFTSFYKNKTYW